MKTPALLRAHLLVLLALTGCAEPDLTVQCDAAEPIESLDQGDVTGEICGPLVFGECPAADTIGSNYLALAGLEGTDDCFASIQQACGPSVVTEDTCCYTVDVSMECIAVGRPLRVHGQARLASARERVDWRSDQEELSLQPSLPDGERWLQIALTEHASIASFARFALELMALGAPSELIDEACRAQHDEVQHALVSFAIAGQLLGRRVGPGPLDVRGLSISADPRRLLIATLLDGCVNESLAAAEAMQGARQCDNPALSNLLRIIGDDETRHAALAWKTVRWLVQEWPELRPVALSTLRQAAANPPAGGDSSANHQVGLLSSAERAALARETMQSVVLPIGLTVLRGSSEKAPMNPVILA